VNAFLLLYAMAISIELVLSMLMALFLYLIVGQRTPAAQLTPDHPCTSRPLARTIDVALRDAFVTVSEGRDDLATITNARSLLSRYAREHAE
jgi:hypothetical protein